LVINGNRDKKQMIVNIKFIRSICAHRGYTEKWRSTKNEKQR